MTPEINDSALHDLTPNAAVLYPDGTIDAGCLYCSDSTAASREQTLSSWAEDQIEARKGRREREEIRKRELSGTELV